MFIDQTIKRSVVCTLIITLIGVTTGCGGADKPSTRDIRARLRGNADVAFEGRAPKALKRRTQARAQAQTPDRTRAPETHSEMTPPEGASCIDSPSCFPRALYLSAEGLGQSPREAEMDAKDQVAAQISSTIESAVRTKTVEGDGLKSRTQGSIQRQVTVRFERAELIETSSAIPVDSGGYRAVAYLSLKRYRAAVELELEREIRALEGSVESAERAPNPEVFVSQWAELTQRRRAVLPALAQYRTIMRALPASYQALTPRLITLERQALKQRQEAHVVIEVSNASTAAPEVRGLMKSLTRRYGVRVSSPGRCLEGRYLLRIESGVEESIHQLTGSALKRLRLGLGLYECGSAGEPREVATRALPDIKGVARYNQSADVVIERQIKQLVKRAQPNPRPAKTRQQRSADRKLQEFSEVVSSLLQLVIPAP